MIVTVSVKPDMAELCKRCSHALAYHPSPTAHLTSSGGCEWLGCGCWGFTT